MSSPAESFVLPEHRMVYVPVAKAASTTLRWMVADLAGEDFSRFYRAVGKHSSRLATINADRKLWRRSPRLDDLPAELVQEISPDNGWFVFSVVRDPWTRLWSAWQSTFLARHQDYLAEYANETWFPREPDQPADIVEDWTNFVRAKPWQSHPTLRHDRQFISQVSAVRPRQMNYTKIYGLAELPVLLDDIRAHLDTVGKGQELYLPTGAEEPVSLAAEVLAGGNAEAIADAYRDDVETFGQHWRVADVAVAETIGTDAVRVISYQIVANERVADLSRQLVSTKSKLAAEKKKLRTAPRARPKLGPLARRVANRLRRELANRRR